jgi:hypothetical protein
MKQLTAQAKNQIDARPFDLEVAPQRASREHGIDVDERTIVVAPLDDSFFDEPDDQLVITPDKLHELLVREPRRHSVTSARTGLV